MENTCCPLTQYKGKGLLEPHFNWFFSGLTHKIILMLYWNTVFFLDSATPWITDCFTAVMQTQCFLQHIPSVERLSQTCQGVCCIHMCSGIGTQKTNWLGTSHMDRFMCSQHQFSTALLSFLWELIYFLFSFLIVWKAHDDIDILLLLQV